MEKTEVGAFIASLRRQRGLTQRELAERLCVSDKAVSRWETGKGLPDPSLLVPLSGELGVSVGELLAGRRLDEAQVRAETDGIIVEAFRYSKRRALSVGLWALALLGAGFLVSPLFLAGSGGAWPIGAALIAVSLIYLYADRRNEKMSGKNGALGIGAFLFHCAALALEALPYGAVLIFSDGLDRKTVKTFSYFSLMPFGYANFWPLFAALLTVTAAVLLALALLRKGAAPKIKNAAFVLTAFAFLFSLLPLMYGGEYMNAVSWGVSGALLVSGALQAAANRNIK